jgi:hypothetical protein
VNRPVWQEPGDTLCFATQSEPKSLVLFRPTFDAGSYSVGASLLAVFPKDLGWPNGLCVRRDLVACTG